jgi:hypothetical protein
MAITLQRQPVQHVREEMRRHREVIQSQDKRPLHPGVTRRELGAAYRTDEHELLARGVCHDLAETTERGERMANWTLIGCGLVVVGYVVLKALGVW